MANLLNRSWSKLQRVAPAADRNLGVYQTKRLLVVAYVYQFHYDLYVRWSHDINLFNVIRDWCAGADLEYSFLRPLVLPAQTVVDETGERAATVQSAMTSTFPDPTDANVFWIQPLVVEMGPEATPAQFQPYLSEVPA